MPDEARLLGAFVVSLVTVRLLTPVAIRVAGRTAFFDHPVGYKAHSVPTPYLGGAAVICAFLISGAIFGDALDRFGWIMAFTFGLAALGTLDDRVAVRPSYRVVAEVAAATALWSVDAGWTLFDSEVANLVLTCIWVLGLVNAFNLMDNLDGATATLGGVCAAGAGFLALTNDDAVLAAFALALAGACAGFLRHNLALPARIFMGDGGSMPLGFAIAAITMLAVNGTPGLGSTALLAAALLVGLLILDTSLVVVSRARHGIPLATGGRDHLTHRLWNKLRSARAVALTLFAVQGLLCAAAIGAATAGSGSVVTVSVVAVVLGLGALVVLESPGWAPPRRERPGTLSAAREKA